MKLLVCITMYNETFSQFLETMAGVIRCIAELEHYDERTYKDRVGIVLVADGSDKLSDNFKKYAEMCGLIDKAILKQYSQVKNKNNALELKKFKKIESG